ncbi:MAG: IclR family acetate operon transcriptional repressor [Paracoccaceae bacterium]|jgi:IclR family acetate operon transcriptional repressor
MRKHPQVITGNGIMPKEIRTRGRPRISHTNGPASKIQSLDRALDVLETLSELGGLTLSQVASELKQSPSTVYRVLTTLEARQIVEVDQTTQTWQIGPATFRLGSNFLRREGLLERSRPIMRQLMEATGETANLGIERQGLVLFVSQIETQETIRAFFPPGTQAPMHSSGIGKALLGQFSENRLARHLRRHSLEGFTHQTITEPDNLRAELKRIRNQGYAFDNEERASGMRCVAVPVIDQYGEAVAGISVSGPINRMSLVDIPEIAKKVIDAAGDLSTQLGSPT